MPSSPNLQFVETFDSTWDVAVDFQELTLQDLKAGGFPNPQEDADPANAGLVDVQQRKLRANPEYYSGFMLNGKVVACLKQNEWRIRDELPFARFFRRLVLLVKYLLTKNPSTGQWGILGLVASDQLSPAEREKVLVELLERALLDPKTGEPRIVNIVVHDHDPLLGIIPRYGFVQVGKRGYAAGTKGLKQLKQPRFQRRVSR